MGVFKDKNLRVIIDGKRFFGSIIAKVNAGILAIRLDLKETIVGGIITRSEIVARREKGERKARIRSKLGDKFKITIT